MWVAPVNHSDHQLDMREIKYEKDCRKYAGYVRKQSRSRDFAMLFERASFQEDGELVLQALVGKLEQRFCLNITPELESLVSSFLFNVDQCSVFGPRTHISRLIQFRQQGGSMQTKKESVKAEEEKVKAAAMSVAPVNHSDHQLDMREIKYEKGYMRKQSRSRDFTMLFERASLKEKVDGEFVLQALVDKLEQRFCLSITPELKPLVPSFPSNVDQCSVFGPRTHISRLIQNEVEALYATKEDAGMARAALLQLWDKRVIAAISDTRRRKISTETLRLTVRTREIEDDSELLDKYEDLKDDSYHEAVTYLLHSNKMSASIESIELLLQHKFYWDAAVLARRYLTPTNEMFQKTFSKWANVFIDKEKGSCSGNKKGYRANAAKCYIIMDMFDKAANQLVKSSDPKSLLLACRLSQIDVKAAELKNDSKAIEIAKKNATDVANVAIRRCLTMCHWDVAVGLIQLMQLGQEWSHVVSMHQALLLRLRPVLAQTRLHQNEQCMLKIPTDSYPQWATNIVSHTFVVGIWDHWKSVFPVDSFEKSAMNALALRDVDDLMHNSHRHVMLFDVACQMVVGLMQGAAGSKDLAHNTFISLLKNCHYFDQIETELDKIFKEMCAVTSDDEQLISITGVLVAVAVERENAANMAAAEAEAAKQKKTEDDGSTTMDVNMNLDVDKHVTDTVEFCRVNAPDDINPCTNAYDATKIDMPIEIDLTAETKEVANKVDVPKEGIDLCLENDEETNKVDLPNKFDLSAQNDEVANAVNTPKDNVNSEMSKEIDLCAETDDDASKFYMPKKDSETTKKIDLCAKTNEDVNVNIGAVGLDEVDASCLTNNGTDAGDDHTVGLPKEMETVTVEMDMTVTVEMETTVTVADVVKEVGAPHEIAVCAKVADVTQDVDIVEEIDMTIEEDEETEAKKPSQVSKEDSDLDLPLSASPCIEQVSGNRQVRSPSSELPTIPEESTASSHSQDEVKEIIKNIVSQLEAVRKVENTALDGLAEGAVIDENANARE